MIDNLMKYVLEGLMVMFASFVIGRQKLTTIEIFLIALISILTFFILDVLFPTIENPSGLKSINYPFLNLIGGDGSDFAAQSSDEFFPQNNEFLAQNNEFLAQNNEFLTQNNSTQNNDFYWNIDGLKINVDHPSMFVTTDRIQQNMQNGGAQDGDSSPRLNDVVYSGDLLNILVNETVMQRGSSNSQVIFDQPLKNGITNLSKLRLVLAEGKHDPTKQTPINYGNLIYIQHNAYVNDTNENKYIGSGDKLQSHQDTSLFGLFQIYSINNPQSNNPIKYGDQIQIKKGNVSGDNVYLRVESDKSVTTQANASSASTFKLKLDQIYELNDRNLCVCPSSRLYP